MNSFRQKWDLIHVISVYRAVTFCIHYFSLAKGKFQTNVAYKILYHADSIQFHLLCLSLPIVTYGHWYEHFLGFWKRRHDDNILFLKYEDMKKVSVAVF